MIPQISCTFNQGLDNIPMGVEQVVLPFSIRFPGNQIQAPDVFGLTEQQCNPVGSPLRFVLHCCFFFKEGRCASTRSGVGATAPTFIYVTFLFS